MTELVRKKVVLEDYHGETYIVDIFPEPGPVIPDVMNMPKSFKLKRETYQYVGREFGHPGGFGSGGYVYEEMIEAVKQ